MFQIYQINYQIVSKSNVHSHNVGAGGNQNLPLILPEKHTQTQHDAEAIPCAAQWEFI